MRLMQWVRGGYVNLVSLMHHANIASLIGYCDEEGEEILVYEWVPCGSLEVSLHPIPGINHTYPLTFVITQSMFAFEAHMLIKLALQPCFKSSPFAGSLYENVVLTFEVLGRQH